MAAYVVVGLKNGEVEVPVQGIPFSYLIIVLLEPAVKVDGNG
jgi:hypothetical protein